MDLVDFSGLSGKKTTGVSFGGEGRFPAGQHAGNRTGQQMRPFEKLQEGRPERQKVRKLSYVGL